MTFILVIIDLQYFFYSNVLSLAKDIVVLLAVVVKRLPFLSSTR
nr:MAG TPA: hypothetical protein [Caudoviricetes sp.]